MSHFITKRVFPGPVWLHFLLLGAVLYAGLTALYPEPKPLLGPPNTTRLTVMADSYAKLVGGQPTAADMERFVDLELRDELLFSRSAESALASARPGH